MSAAIDAPVADAAARGDAAAVEALLKQGADVNSAQGDGMTALHWAAMNDEASLATMLLRAGANPRAATRVGAYTPLLLAAKLGHHGVVEALLAGGRRCLDQDRQRHDRADVRRRLRRPGSVELLLARKPDVNARESTRGLTAAMFAAAADRAAVITVLAGHGADLSATSTPLDLRVLDRSRVRRRALRQPVAAQDAGWRGRVGGRRRTQWHEPAPRPRPA